MDWNTSSGPNDNAVLGTDYTGTSDTLRFKAGETQGTVSVPIADNALNDGPRTFTVTLSDPSGLTLDPAHTTATGTILDDEGSGGGTGSQNIQLWIEDGRRSRATATG